MAFRTSWLRTVGFDERLRGDGAQVHNDLMACLQVRRAGGQIIYDPQVLVDHYPAQRPAGDVRTHGTFASFEEVHNETLALIGFLPMWRRSIWLAWCVLRGTRRSPGLVIAVALLPTMGLSVLRALLECWRGRVAGVQTAVRGPRQRHLGNGTSHAV